MRETRSQETGDGSQNGMHKFKYGNMTIKHCFFYYLFSLPYIYRLSIFLFDLHFALL